MSCDCENNHLHKRLEHKKINSTNGCGNPFGGFPPELIYQFFKRALDTAPETGQSIPTDGSSVRLETPITDLQIPGGVFTPSRYVVQRTGTYIISGHLQYSARFAGGGLLTTTLLLKVNNVIQQAASHTIQFASLTVVPEEVFTDQLILNDMIHVNANPGDIIELFVGANFMPAFLFASVTETVEAGTTFNGFIIAVDEPLPKSNNDKDTPCSSSLPS